MGETIGLSMPALEVLVDNTSFALPRRGRPEKKGNRSSASRSGHATPYREIQDARDEPGRYGIQDRVLSVAKSWKTRIPECPSAVCLLW